MKTKIAVVAAIALLILSCKKEGTTGSTTIATIVKHHEKLIPGATVYVKYGAKDFPGEDLSKYDDSKVTDKNAHVHFENLQIGNYYFYAIGFDSSITETVKGGIPTNITSKDKNAHKDLIVPVVE